MGRFTLFFGLAVLAALCCGAVSASAMPVTWDYTKDDGFGGHLVYSHGAVSLDGGQLSGSVPSFLGQSWPLASGRCWTGVSGVSWDDKYCNFALETTTRPANCTRQKKVHVRVWVGKGKHRHRVWRWRWRTIKFARNVAVTVQLEIAHNPGEAYYFYPDKQWEYGPNAPLDTYPPNSHPVDEHYPQEGTKTIECAAPWGISPIDEGASDDAYP